MLINRVISLGTQQDFENPQKKKKKKTKTKTKTKQNKKQHFYIVYRLLFN